MRGRPLTCRCPKCRNRASSGAYWRIWFTGLTRRVMVQRGRRNGAALTEKYQAECGCCGHTWWSTYRGITKEP